MAANNSYEQAVALIASANRVVQDPNSVGAALRTISLRLRGTSVKELEEAGEDTTGAVTSKSKLRSKVKSLSGVDILTDTGAYKDTYTILLEISKVWEKMSDIDQAALLELIAGKTRSNTAAAILSNAEDLKDAYEAAMEAEGSALRENEKYLDSIQGKMDQFNNAVQTMWNNALDSELIKGLVDLGTELIKIINKLGLFNSLLIAISSYAMLKHKMGPITFFKELLGLIPQSVRAIQTWVQSFQDAVEAKGFAKAIGVTSDLSDATMTLTRAQLKEKLASEDLLDSEIEEIITKTKLGKATDNLSKKQLDATLKEMGFNEEKRKSILQTVFDTEATNENTAANAANTASNVAAGEAEDKDTVDTVENTAATKVDTEVTNENTKANIENAASNQIPGQMSMFGGDVSGGAKAVDAVDDVPEITLNQTPGQISMFDDVTEDISKNVVDDVADNIASVDFNSPTEVAKRAEAIRAKDAKLWEDGILPTYSLQDSYDLAYDGLYKEKQKLEQLENQALLPKRKRKGRLSDEDIQLEIDKAKEAIKEYEDNIAFYDRLPTGDIANEVAESVSDGITEGVTEGVSGGAIEGIADGISEGVTSGVADGISEGVTEGLSRGVAEGISDGIAEGVTDGITSGATEGIVDGISEGITGGVTKGASDSVLDTISRLNNEAAESFRIDFDDTDIKPKKKSTLKEKISKFFKPTLDLDFDDFGDDISDAVDDINFETLDNVPDIFDDISDSAFNAVDNISGVADNVTDLASDMTNVADSITDVVDGATDIANATANAANTASNVAASVAEDKNTKDKIENIAITKVDTEVTEENTKKNLINAASSVAAGEAEDKDTRDTLENVGATLTDTATTGANTASNLAGTGSNMVKGASKGAGATGLLAKLGIGKAAGATASAGASAGAGAFTGLAAAVPIILAVVATIGALVVAYDLANDSVEELREKLKKSQAEYDDARSKIESLNSELETSNNRIAELIAKPSLSFIEQEELDNLRETTAQLERQIDLQEELAKTKEAKLKSDTDKTIDAIWNSTEADKAYYVNASGVIHKDEGWSGFWGGGTDTKKALDTAFDHYQKNSDDIKKIEDMLLLDWDSLSHKEKVAKIDELNVGNRYFGTETFDKYAEDALTDLAEKNTEILDGINMVLTDDAFEGIEYGDSIKGNKFLDEIYAYNLRSSQIQGNDVKSKAISTLFDKTASQDMQNLGRDLQAIADDVNIVDKNQAILNRLGQIDGIDDGIVQIDQLSDSYSRLNATMSIVGVTAQDISDYFVLKTGDFDSNTPEGIMNQYQAVKELLSDLENNKINLDDLVDYDANNNEATAKAVEIAELLKGVGPEVREEFSKIIEDIKEGTLEYDDAIKKLDLSSMRGVLELVREEMVSVNKNMFPDLEIDGWIDSVEELKGAFESLASSMDLIHTAQKQMNSSGRISLKTALDLMSSTDQWNEILEVNNGVITMNANAEEILINSKLELIRQNLEAAISETELQISLMEGAINSQEAGNTFREGFTNAIVECQGIVAGLKEMWDAFWSGEDVITAFNTGRNAALQKLTPTQSSLSAEKQKLKDLEDKLAAIEDWDAEDFADYYDYDETPGDKYDDGDGSVVEAIQKKYESKIKNLENQQTYLENEIERNEALNNGTSIDYYKEQIALENQKIDLYEQEREALLKLEMNDEVAEALWEVEHALQKSTLAAIEFGNAMHEMQMEGINKISEAYANMDTISENRMRGLELYKEGVELDGDFVSDGFYKDMISLAKEDVKRKGQEVKDVSNSIDEYRKMENPHEKGTEEYDSWELTKNKNLLNLQAQHAEAKIAEAEAINAVKQLQEDQKDNYIAAWDNISQAFDQVNSFYQNQLDFIDAYEERLNTLNINVPDSVYKQKIRTQQDVVSSLSEELEGDRELLEEYAKKYGTDDQRYIDKLNEVSEKEAQLYQEKTKIVEYQQQIFDNSIDKFNQVIDRINNATKQLQNVSNLIADEDVATEDGAWTAEGTTRLGLAHQEMAYNKEVAEQYADEMKDVQDAYDSGRISEKKYYETMQELSDGQWEAINAYEETKDAIVAIEEARIDMIEEGINKEIEAYQELIDLKKEELDAERDLHDFRKNIEKQTKDIAALERRIASMSGSTDAATIAERTKLEAQLREAKEGLNDTYYDHSMDAQSKALDDELEAFTKSGEDYIKSLRESLEDVDKLIETTYQHVLENGQIVFETMTSYSEEYGFKIDNKLTSPWKNATEKSLDFEKSASSHVKRVWEAVTTFEDPLITSLAEPWGKAAKESLTFSEEAPKKLTEVLEDAQDKQQDMSDTLCDPWNKAKAIIDLMPTYADEAARQMLEDAKEYVAQINAELDKIKYPSYEGDNTNPGGNTDPGGNKTPGGGTSVTYIGTTQGFSSTTGGTKKTINGVSYTQVGDVYYKTSDTFTNTSGGATVYGVKKGSSAYYIGTSKPKSQFEQNYGIYGPQQGQTYKTSDAVVVQDNITGSYYVAWSGTGTGSSRSYWIQGGTKNNAESIKEALKSKKGWTPLHDYNVYSKKYAKGTMGTTQNQWAITDEPWLGDELVLVPTAQGNLSYMRKGTSVVPADITENLVKWGQMNPDMASMSNAVHGVNLMSNVVNKPELNLTFDALVKADNITEETLPAVKKLVTQELDRFAKELNYSIKKYK